MLPTLSFQGEIRGGHILWKLEILELRGFFCLCFCLFTEFGAQLFTPWYVFSRGGASEVPRTGSCHTAQAVPTQHTHPRHCFAFGLACGSDFQALFSVRETRNRFLSIYFIKKKSVYISPLPTSAEPEFPGQGETQLLGDL